MTIQGQNQVKLVCFRAWIIIWNGEDLKKEIDQLSDLKMEFNASLDDETYYQNKLAEKHFCKTERSFLFV